MKILKKQQLAFLVMLSVCCSSTALAVPVGYTDYTSFMSALPSSANVLNFDAETYGDIINSGASIDGVTFSYDFGGVSMMVTDDYLWPTTSSANLLGTNDGDMLQDGDDFSLSFASSNGIGMFFISADTMYDNDITLTAGGVSARLFASDRVSLGLDDDDYEWFSYFIGIVDEDATFTNSDIATTGGGYFLYNVDDIITSTPVPEPQALLLFVSGLIALAGVRRNRISSP